jgi:hypothetical protein
MINIISTSLASKKTRGPKKVVQNLMKGLEKIGYPYVVNKALDSCERLWIHDDVYALEKIKDLPEKIKIVIGPNLFVNPENIPKSLDLSRTVYIQPSSNVVNIWKKRGYTQSPLESWPVGIDSEAHAPTTEQKSQKASVLVYFKNREKKELEKITALLSTKSISHSIISYGSYTENEYADALKKARYIIWLGIYESQGIAMEEAMSTDVPLLVLDRAEPISPFDTESTSAPYFSPECGLILRGLDETKLSEAIDTMEQTYSVLHPRNFILRNLSLEKQAQAFVGLYEKHLGLSVENGMLQKSQADAIKDPWNGESFIHKTFRKLL